MKIGSSEKMLKLISPGKGCAVSFAAAWSVLCPSAPPGGSRSGGGWRSGATSRDPGCGRDVKARGGRKRKSPVSSWSFCRSKNKQEKKHSRKPHFTELLMFEHALSHREEFVLIKKPVQLNPRNPCNSNSSPFLERRKAFSSRDLAVEELKCRSLCLMRLYKPETVL